MDETRKLGKYRRVAGELILVDIEHSAHPERIDHVWIDIRAEPGEMLRITVNTKSLQSERLGFDSRIWVGRIAETWDALPAPGIFAPKPWNYDAIERRTNVFYEVLDQREMELLLIEKSNQSILIEAWGDIYCRNHTGLHQVHCRRASAAVPHDVPNRDGALKFYFKERKAETLLLKFYGQR